MSPLGVARLPKAVQAGSGELVLGIGPMGLAATATIGDKLCNFNEVAMGWNSTLDLSDSVRYTAAMASGSASADTAPGSDPPLPTPGGGSTRAPTDGANW